MEWMRLRQGVFGAFGGLLPEIVAIYQNQRLADAMELDRYTSRHYLLLTLIYIGSAAIVASIYPYRGRRTAWRALLIGIALPTLIGTAAGLLRIASPNEIPVDVRAGDEAGEERLLDLIALF